jgi:eukaryotic-like serine/threonine-protein kinase
MSPASPPSGTFDPRVYERLTALFDELVEVDPATRRARLKALAESEADLARELEALLLADARAEGILERSPTTMAREVATGYESGEYETPVVALPKTEAGMRLGPWRLLEPIGEGGMGEVWKAERADDSFDQFVAVKILRQGVVSAGMHRRFLVERQILARLHHPAIARLLDGGVAPDGRPYFVMELVQGLPLHEHARSKKLGIDDRLRLFTTGCEAVEAAHRQLVVHRDLKPSNILVSEAGEVKLLDFGIAKVLEPDLFTEAEGATRLDGRALTPEYAAPEQILGEPVTTATDVYGLGLVLYELLVGKRPFRRDGSLGEMVEALDSEEPDRRRPSSCTARVPKSSRRPNASAGRAGCAVTWTPSFCGPWRASRSDATPRSPRCATTCAGSSPGARSARASTACSTGPSSSSRGIAGRRWRAAARRWSWSRACSSPCVRGRRIAPRSLRPKLH